jgi:hypothetical protein
MPSQKQIDANRRNAQKSTGPVTEAGKAVAKFNALRHGMTVQSAVLPYEDHLAYAMLREALLGHYAPANIAEELLVDVVANSYLLPRTRPGAGGNLLQSSLRDVERADLLLAGRAGVLQLYGRWQTEEEEARRGDRDDGCCVRV